jgi:hypothetical protein
MMVSRFSCPSDERMPILTCPETMMYSRSPGSPLAEHGVPAWEVDALKLRGERGDRTGFDSLEDSCPA